MCQVLGTQVRPPSTIYSSTETHQPAFLVPSCQPAKSIPPTCSPDLGLRGFSFLVRPSVTRCGHSTPFFVHESSTFIVPHALLGTLFPRICHTTVSVRPSLVARFKFISNVKPLSPSPLTSLNVPAHPHPPVLLSMATVTRALWIRLTRCSAGTSVPR